MKQKLHNHIHKFRRKIYKTGNSVYFCVDDCNYKIGVEFSLGKMTRCNNCDKAFQMNEYSIRAAKPKCMDCIKRKTITKGGIDANIMVESISKSIAADSITELKNKMDNLIIKEYKPEDEEIEL